MAWNVVREQEGVLDVAFKGALHGGGKDPLERLLRPQFSSGRPQSVLPPGRLWTSY